MQIELFYTRYHKSAGHLLRGDKFSEFPVGCQWALENWSEDAQYAVEVAERMFKAWSCIQHENSSTEWVAFAAIVDRKRIVIGVEAVRELLATEEK